MKTVFMGTPEFALPAFEALHRITQVVCVYTQPDRKKGRGLEVQFTPVKIKANEYGLTLRQPEKLITDDEVSFLKKLNPDLIVVVAYGQILNQEILDLPTLACLNVHASLLPRWRGAAPIHWALLEGDLVTGVCVQRMVLKLDAGPVIHSLQTEIQSRDTYESLYGRLAKLGGECLKEVLETIHTKNKDLVLQGNPQDETKVTLAKKITKEMAWLNPYQLTAVELDRKIRALSHWPGTHLKTQGERLKIISATLAPQNIKVMPGVLEEQFGMLLLGTTQGALELKKVQWEGKKEVGTLEFLNAIYGRGKKLPFTVDKT